MKTWHPPSGLACSVPPLFQGLGARKDKQTDARGLRRGAAMTGRRSSGGGARDRGASSPRVRGDATGASDARSGAAAEDARPGTTNLEDLGRRDVASDGGRANGSMPPPPSIPREADGRARTGVPNSNEGGARVDERTRTPMYAELRRLTSSVPSTPTLPDEIPLPRPGDTAVLTIGRHRLNTVNLDCPHVPSLLSRQHAEFHCDAQGVHYVTDKNTLNGTYVNGNLIPSGPCALAPGDVVAFGGPANVLRDNQTLRNSFRYEYKRPLDFESWKVVVAAAEEPSSSPASDVKEARPSKRARVDAGSPRSARPSPPSNSPSARIGASEAAAASPEDTPAADAAAGRGEAPDGYRGAGRAIVKLSRRDAITVRRVASKMEARSRRFLSDAVNEVGAVLAECVVPSLPGDEGALRDVISDAVTRGEFSSLCRVVIQHARDSEDSVGEMEMTQATQATQEYVCPLPTDVAEHGPAATQFLRETCRDALEMHVSPGGAVAFTLKLLNARRIWDSEAYAAMEASDAAGPETASHERRFHRGDLIAEAVGLALWPLPQLGLERGAGEAQAERSANVDCVFSSSVCEIDGHGCNIGPSGCAALAEGALAPRQTSDGNWTFNECLRGLNLGDNPRLGDRGCAAVAAALEPRERVNGSRARQLTKMFNTALTTLDLSGCGIGVDGIVPLVNALRMVPDDNGDRKFPSNLRSLNLSGNRLGAKGCRYVAQILGPDPNTQKMRSPRWFFNPSLAMLDLSDNTGMDDSVAEVFAKALMPKLSAPDEETTSESRDERAGKKQPSHVVNTALLELRLCGHQFENGIDRIREALDPARNGSAGSAAAAVAVVFERNGSEGAVKERVFDDDGHDHELVLPVATGCATESRPLSRSCWRSWMAPKSSTSRDDPRVAPDAPATQAEKWYQRLEEDHLADGSKASWSAGYALRNTLLHRLEGGDSILSQDPGSCPSADLPEWLTDELTCVICTDIFVNPYAVGGCGHVFCHECVSHWLTTRSNQCPICRHRLSLPISLALTPCNMAQGLLDHYVLPYLPAKDVEARRERAREVRDKAAKRAAEASRPAAMPGGLAGSVAAATAALAQVFGGRGGAINAIRISAGGNMSTMSLFQEMMEVTQARQRRSRRAGTSQGGNGAPPTTTTGGGDAAPPTTTPGDGDDAPTTDDDAPTAATIGVGYAMPHGAVMVEALRNLTEARRRREGRQASATQRTVERGEQGNTAGDRSASAAARPSPPRHSSQPVASIPLTEGVRWTAMSSCLEIETPCAHCGKKIPPRFLRMQRKRGSIAAYYHPNIECLKAWQNELCSPGNVQGLQDVSAQENRVIGALLGVLAGPVNAGGRR